MSQRYAGVVGWPVEHSLSPVIHNLWLAQAGIKDTEYRKLPIEPEKLGEWIQTLKTEPCVGVNLTIPHKEIVLPFLDKVDVTASHIGAVNTVAIRDRQLLGFNTDAYGFITNLKTYGGKYHRQTAMVIGAGGAARAAVMALVEDGFSQIIIMNRTREKAEQLTVFGDHIKVIDWNDSPEVMNDVDVLINTTSLGMTGQEPLTLNISKLPDHAVVNDIVYSPLETDLLKQAKAQHLVTVDGLGMLLYQAQKAFEIWFGILPDIDQDLRNMVISAMRRS